MSLSDHVFLQAEDVWNFVKQFALTREGYKKGNEVFDELKADLKQKYQHYQAKEKEAYDKFGVDGLPELQERIDLINNSSLCTFANSYIQQSNAYLKSFQGITNQMLNDAFVEFLEKEKILDKSQDILFSETEDQIVQKIFDSVFPKMKEIRMEQASKGFRETSIIQSTSLKATIKDFVKYLKNEKKNYSYSPAYRKDFMILFDRLPGSTWSISVPDTTAQEIQSMPKFNQLNYYPYFGLTDAQKVIALNLNNETGRLVWTNFKSHILDVVQDAINSNTYLTKTSAEAILDQLGPKAFIKDDFNGIKGILGEVQMLFIAQALMGKTEIIASGPAPNLLKDKAELGADVLLDRKLGIQVKNYQGYRAEKSEGYYLKKDLSWNELMKRMGENTIVTDIGTYFSALCYNKPLNIPEADNYRQFYNKFLSAATGSVYKSVTAYLAANIDHFITLSEAYRILVGDLTIDDYYDNAFYFFGGKTLIPVSYIIGLILQRITELSNRLSNNDRATMDNIVIKTFYDGQIYTEESPAVDINLTHQQVLQSLNIRLQLNLYLENLNLKNGGPIIHL